MELRDIEYFSVIAEHRHLGRAAEALKLSASALTKCLRRLERALQVKLVTRTSKGVALTPEGAVLHAHAQRLQVSLTDVAREVSELSRGVSDQLRVGALPGFAVDSLVTAASVALFDEPSKVVLTVSIGERDTMLPALRNGDLDLFVTAIPSVPYDGVVLEHLHEDDFLVCAAANHRLAKRKQVTLADLAQESWAMTNRIEFWPTFARAFADNGLPPPRIALVTIVTSLMVRTIASTQLLGFVSRGVFDQARSELPLVELPLNKVLWHRRLGIGYRKDAYLSPAARRFIDFLKAAAKGVTAAETLPW
jgi:DNA-binding transcriptional LysR family regulator